MHRNEPVEIEVLAEPIGQNKVRCSLFSERTLKTGKTLRSEHFTGLSGSERPPSWGNRGDRRVIEQTRLRGHLPPLFPRRGLPGSQNGIQSPACKPERYRKRVPRRHRRALDLPTAGLGSSISGCRTPHHGRRRGPRAAFVHFQSSISQPCDGE